jgi:predicted N-acetyltransferase YhbS
MQSLAQRVWSPESRFHIGDIAWGRFSIPGAESGFRTSLWHDRDVVRAWGWAELPNYLDILVDRVTPDLAADVLSWFAEVATGPNLTCTVMEGDQHVIDALERAGYARQTAGPYFARHTISLDTLEEPSLPKGYRLRHLDASEAKARAQVHRDSWSDFGSKLTTESYARVMNTWPYRPETDWVVETPTGELVASALGWLDEENKTGLVEPVGCVPEHRGQGLGAAVNLALLNAFRQHGATIAVVLPRGDEDYPKPGRLYRRIGFKPGSRTFTYVRDSAL